MIEIKINTLRGIPPGIRAAKKNSSPETKFQSHKIKPRKPVISTNILEKLLCEGKKHHERVIELLKVFPENIEDYKQEYQALLEKEVDLKNLIDQLKSQLQVREEKKNRNYCGGHRK